MIKDMGVIFTELGDQFAHQGAHFRIGCIRPAQSKDMKPFAERSFHDNDGGGGIGKNLAGVFWLHAAIIDLVTVMSLRCMHGKFPVAGGTPAFYVCVRRSFRKIEIRFDEGNLARSVVQNIALRLNGKGCMSMPGDFSHDITRSDKLDCDILKLQRTSVAAPDQRLDKLFVAVVGGIVVRAVTITAGILDPLLSLCGGRGRGGTEDSG